MNGEVCCILGVCCPPGSARQVRALEEEMVKAGCASADAEKMAPWILQHFDLAPAGTLAPFRDAIVRMAEHRPQAPSNE